MKKSAIISTLIFCCISTRPAAAQIVSQDSARPCRFEIGLHLYELEFSNPSFFFGREVDPYENYFISGAQAKWWKGNRAWRVSIGKQSIAKDLPATAQGYYINVLDAASQVNFVDQKTATFKSRYHLSAGRQFVLTRTKLAPYYFADLAFSVVSESGTHTVTRWNYGFSYESYELYTNVTRQLGLANGMGLRLQAGRFIVLNFETQFSAYVQRLIDRDHGQKVNQAGLTLHPARLSIGLYF